jgi:hypothetical protein
VNAKNEGTTSVSFGFHIPCEDEVKLYRNAAHSGPPLHFRPGTRPVGTGRRTPGAPPGRVDIALAPDQEHTEDCGQFSLDDVVQEDERPAPPGVYYVVLDLGRSATGQLLTVNAGIIVVGTSVTDPRDRGPFESRLTGTSALVDSALYVIFTEESKYYKRYVSSCRWDAILLYPDSLHSGIPFREIVEPEPIGVDVHGKEYFPDPDLQGPRELWKDCVPIPIVRLRQGTKSITPGTYYVVYDFYDHGEKRSQAIGTVTIP